MGLVLTYIFTLMSNFIAYMYVNQGWTLVFIVVPSAIFASWLHGFAHSFVAKKYNCLEKQNIANPLKHIAPVGLLLSAVVGFGWAKMPKMNLDRATKKQKLLIHCSGLIANLLAAIAISVIEGILLLIAFVANDMDFGGAIYLIADIIIWMNIALMIVELLPIPGFDGYYILKDLFFGNCKSKVLTAFEKFSKYILIVLIVLGITYWCSDLPTSAVFNALADVQEFLIDIITGGDFSAAGW